MKAMETLMARSDYFEANMKTLDTRMQSVEDYSKGLHAKLDKHGNYRGIAACHDPGFSCRRALWDPACPTFCPPPWQTCLHQMIKLVS